MSRLSGKIAVITGGSSGIGLSTAQQFVDEGAFVFITGRRQTELDSAVKLIGKNVIAVQGDAAKLDDLDRLYSTVKKEKGHLDIVFANAGIGAFAPLGAIEESHYNLIFDVNVKGVLFTVQKALPLLRDGGSIILNASIVSYKGMPAFSVYSATKAAVRSFARTWSVDLKERKIRVNAISPGVVPTPGYNTSLDMSAQQVDEFAAFAASTTPLGRVGKPEEIAKVVAFLASDEASFINAIELTVDGGFAQI
jgi:NAD(P)-dependent dehydrogenase (short-subunit alcohol dehydrogenase family)